MPVQVNEQTADAVNLSNVKLLGELHSISAGLSAQNQLANQQHVQAIIADSLQQTMLLSRNATANALAFSQAVTARAVRFAFDLSAEEAVGFGKQIQSDLQSLQEQVKTAQTTPPQTGTGGAFGSDAGSALLQQLVNQVAVLANAVEALKKP